MSVSGVRRGVLGLLAAGVWLIGEAVAVAAPPMAARDPLAMDDAQLAIDSRADKLNYDRANGVLEAVGNAVIRRGDVEMRADYIRINVNTGDSDALGDVSLKRGEDVWTGPTLKYNFKTGAGLTSDMKVTAAPFHVRAETSERTPEGAYILNDAWASTCNPDEGPVDFHVTARQMEVVPDEYIKARGAVWWFGPVPCMYVPYWYRDLDSDFGWRFTPGYSSESGAFLLSSYRYRINDGLTASTHLDYRTERGVAGGQDFRWNTGEDQHVGDFRAYYADDQEPMDDHDAEEGKDIDSERYRLRYHDQFVVSERDLVLARAHYLSDPDMLEDFFEDEFRDERQPDNYASYTHRGDAYTANGIVRSRLNDFYENVNRLPEASVDWFRQPLADTPVYYEGQTAAGFIQRQYAEGSDLEDYDAFRFDTEHMIFYPDKYLGFLTFVPRAGARGTYYSDTRRSETVIESSSITDTNGIVSVSTNAVTRDVAAGSDMRGSVELGFETSYKAFQVYDTAYGPRRHIVEPFADYTLVPEPNITPDELYQFDEVDTLDEQHTIEFGVRQKWQEKRDSGAFDLVDLQLSSVLNIHQEPDQDAIEYLFWDGEFRPADGWAIDTDGSWKFSDGILETFNTWLTYTGWDDLEARVENRYRDEEDDANDSNVLIGDLTLFPARRWSYNGYARYEFEESRTEEVGGYIQHIFTCIGLRVGGNFMPGFERTDGTEEDDEFRFLLEFWLTAFPDTGFGSGDRHRG